MEFNSIMRTNEITGCINKKDPELFLSITSSKSTDFNAVFTVRFKNKWHMCKYECHPPHLINGATLPCKN